MSSSRAKVENIANDTCVSNEKKNEQRMSRGMEIKVNNTFINPECRYVN